MQKIFWLKHVARSGAIAGLLTLAANKTNGAEPPDPLLDLFIKKGFVTQEEAAQVKAEADSLRTNRFSATEKESRWAINKAIKNMELFGDIRLRYEDREAEGPNGGKVKLQRGRYAVRVGVRGDVFDDFYYGLRLDTSANPRSAWGTFGQAAVASPPYQGPFGKSNGGINVSQVYLGWRPEPWANLTVGQMPNPLYTTPMVWDSDYNPVGAAERFNYTVGEADFFANFGQFLYQDANPSFASPNYGFGVAGGGQRLDNPFQLAWQAGLTHRIQTNLSVKVAATVYQYIGLNRRSPNSPFFGSDFVGEGAYLGTNYTTANGFSGYGANGANSLGFPNNQAGLNHLLIVEAPFEANYKMGKVDARVYGDFSYNLEGSQRAREAQAGYASWLSSFNTPAPSITPFAPQTKDVKAYQAGLALATPGDLGMVYGSACKKHAWEVRAYWQHVEQYALDPNLLDSDFFEGRGNLEGIYAAAAYGFANNILGTVRYGYATRINKLLGTGGSNQDIPQVNPITRYHLLQFDLTFKF